MGANSNGEPRISVLMPVYQAERYLEEAVESILAQSFDDFELLALDDGSTDASPRILEALASCVETHVGALREAGGAERAPA